MSGPERSRLRSLALVLGLTFLYVPILWIVVYSFSDSTIAGIWKGFSLRWYEALLENEDFRLATGRSLLLGALSASVATLIGTATAWTLARRPGFRSTQVLAGLAAIPLLVPELLTGFSFLMLFVVLEAVLGLPISKGLVPLTAGHATMGVPIVASTVLASFIRLDRSFEEAALDLGASPLRVLCTITLPLLRPAILSGWVLAFTLSFDDVITSSFLAGPSNTTLPLLVYSSMRTGINPQTNAIGTLIIASVTVLVILVAVSNRGRAPSRILNVPTQSTD